MLGSVYAHIFGAANARRDVYELSRRVYEHEDPEFDVDEWVAGAHPLDDHALEHPLVTELVGQGADRGSRPAVGVRARQWRRCYGR